MSLLWVTQDLYHQPYDVGTPEKKGARSQEKLCEATATPGLEFVPPAGFYSAPWQPK